MIAVFTPQRNSPDCPSKSKYRPVKFSILTPQLYAHRGGGMHIAELYTNLLISPKSKKN